MATIKKVDPKKTFLLKGGFLNQLIEAANQWSSLEVKWGPAGSQPALNRGNLKSTLTIPQWTSAPGTTDVRTFYATKKGTENKVVVTPGSILGGIYEGGEYNIVNGSRVYLSADFGFGGGESGEEPAVNVGVASAVPSNTDDIAYALLAYVTSVSGVLKVNQTAWNYSMAQACGVSTTGINARFW